MKYSQLSAAANYALEEVLKYRDNCITAAEHLLRETRTYLGAPSEMIYAVPEDAPLERILQGTVDLSPKKVFRLDGQMTLRFDIFMPIRVSTTYLNFRLPTRISFNNLSFEISIFVGGEEFKCKVDPGVAVDSSALIPLLGQVFSKLNNMIVDAPKDVLAGNGSGYQADLIMNIDSMLRA